MPQSASSSRLTFPVIGITTGDPAGIGPEVSLRAANDPGLQRICRMILFGDAGILRERAGMLNLPFSLRSIRLEELGGGSAEPVLVEVPAGRDPITPGQGSSASGEAAARSILACVSGCRDGQLQAMVTAPIHKKHLAEAGYPYPGHTEFLAQLAGVSSVAMAFLTDRLKVVLVTIHLPLSRAIERITAEAILEKLGVTVREFQRLSLPCGRIAVAALNPHAGEQGMLGMEEIERIEPAIREARSLYPGTVIEGPAPADTIFHRAAEGEFDVVLALYHDQGLIPIKLLGFGEAVNVTLGLPFIRTSVDHGTAFDIAGKGLARPDSMVSAVRWAVRLARPG